MRAAIARCFGAPGRSAPICVQVSSLRVTVSRKAECTATQEDRRHNSPPADLAESLTSRAMVTPVRIARIAPQPCIEIPSC